jgi:hypothetical protein
LRESLKLVEEQLAWLKRQIFKKHSEKVAWARSEEERLRIRLGKEVPIIDELIAKIKPRLVSEVRSKRKRGQKREKGAPFHFSSTSG